MLNKVIQVYKKCGETPLDCINKLKNDDPNLKFLPMTYAGRLDPLAEGVLLILVGDECHKKDEYTSLSKEYEVDILFGFRTDTYDVMGKIIKLVEAISGEEVTMQIHEIIPEFIGKIKQSYPPFSSRTVKGKPLFEWAKEDKLGEIEIPAHDVLVKNIEIISEDFISGEKLLEKIKNDINKVNGNFRQREILNIWHDELKNEIETNYKIIKIRISCGSGVYVRGIANELGNKLGIGALALKIVRTKVGDYFI